MKDKKYVVELVVYKIKSEATKSYKTEIIDSFRKLVMSFDGFISYQFLKSSNDNQVFMDLVLWDSIENAKNAARKVKEIQKGEAFIPYINSFEEVIIFDHFEPLHLWTES